MRFLLIRIMSYLEVGDFRQIVKNFIGLDGYGADFDIESLSRLFIRLFGGKEEISAIANLLDIEIVGCFHSHGLSPVPGQGTKIPQAVWRSQKKRRLERTRGKC